MEYGFVELDDGYSSVSSIMPQKKNPQALEHVKAVAAMAVGALNTVLACSKNTALADVNDGVSAGNAPALDTIERVTKALAVFDGTIDTLTLRPEVMRRSAEIGFGTATELADVIVRETGLSFRMAHNIVGRVVRKALDPAENLKTRDVTGGPAPVRMAEMLDRREATLARDLSAIAAITQRIADADTELERLTREALAAAGLSVPTQQTREGHGAS
jgi:argininosuccinate lyase